MRLYNYNSSSSRASLWRSKLMSNNTSSMSIVSHYKVRSGTVFSTGNRNELRQSKGPTSLGCCILIFLRYSILDSEARVLPLISPVLWMSAPASPSSKSPYFQRSFQSISLHLARMLHALLALGMSFRRIQIWRMSYSRRMCTLRAVDPCLSPRDAKRNLFESSAMPVGQRA